MRWMIAGAVVLGVLAGHAPARAADAGTLVAVLHDVRGRVVGAATLTEVDGGMTIKVIADGLPRGAHAVELAPVGKCDAPGFAGAGTGSTPAGPITLDVSAKGKGSVSFLLPGASVPTLLDRDGAAVLVRDGDARIACGIVQTS